MMAKRRRTNKKWLWIAGVILVVGIGSGVAVAMINNNNDGSAEGEMTGVEEDEGNTEEEKVDDVDEEELKEIEEQGEKQKVPQYEGENPNESESLTGTISYMNSDTEKWMIRVNIDQYLTSGQCELSLYQGGNVVYTETTNVMGGASTSTCEGFDVALSKLPSGTLGVKIKISSGDKTGTIEGETSI